MNGERPNVVRRLLNGLKGALAVTLASPFIILLLPLWAVYRWNEQRAGRPVPMPPWSGLFGRHVDPDAGQRERERIKALYAAVRAEEALGKRPASGRVPPPPRPSPLQGLPSLGAVALVTGGARRLGAEICRDLAAQGFRVAVGYHHSREAAEALVAEITAAGGSAAAFAADLGDPSRVEPLLEEVEGALGPLGVLVNNAALFHPTDPEDAAWEGLERLLAVNLRGPLQLSLAAARRMRVHGNGLIVNMGDVWGSRPLGGHAAYSASKAGLMMATRALARDLAPQVRVNAIAPGAVLPPEGEEGMSGYRRLLHHTPLARYAGPEPVLLALRYLLGAEYVTGEVLTVDGGRTLV